MSYTGATSIEIKGEFTHIKSEEKLIYEIVLKKNQTN